MSKTCDSIPIIRPFAVKASEADDPFQPEI